MSNKLTDSQRRAIFATSLVLVLANLLPLIGVWKLDWSVFDLLVLYWLEIIFVGVFNVLRMVLIKPVGAALNNHLLKVVFVPFFAGHFGLFCVGLGLALQSFFGKDNFEAETQIISLVSGSGSKIFWPLLISHLFAFFWLYIAKREYQLTTVMKHMFSPYARVFPIAFFAIGFAFLASKFDFPKWALFSLVGGKTLVDLIVHTIMHTSVLSRGISMEPS